MNRKRCRCLIWLIFWPQNFNVNLNNSDLLVKRSTFSKRQFIPISFNPISSCHSLALFSTLIIFNSSFLFVCRSKYLWKYLANNSTTTMMAATAMTTTTKNWTLAVLPYAYMKCRWTSMLWGFYSNPIHRIHARVSVAAHIRFYLNVSDQYQFHTFISFLYVCVLVIQSEMRLIWYPHKTKFSPQSFRFILKYTMTIGTVHIQAMNFRGIKSG